MKTIKKYLAAFEQAISRLDALETYDMNACIDAYEALHRLRDRVKKEYSTLNSNQKSHLDKFFSNDIFAKGMSNIRTVGAHVQKRDGVETLTIVTTSNQPIELPIETSALQVFEDQIVTLEDVHDVPCRLDHKEWLSEAQKRAAAAITNAENDP